MRAAANGAVSLKLLLLLAVANTTPLLLTRWLHARLAWPLDAGLRFFDGRPLLGASKTWRGLAGAVLATAAAAPLLGLTAAVGAGLGAAALAGDALSSFVKRRLGLPSSSRATGLDQVPEALLPLLLLRTPLSLSGLEVAATTTLFFVLEIPLAAWFHRLGLRERPF